jgi:hypothetical protein
MICSVAVIFGKKRGVFFQHCGISDFIFLSAVTIANNYNPQGDAQ